MGQALYRLYRPKTFNEVVGQQHITTVLLNQIKEGNPSHAYLFIGSRGTGKTTCAKLMAKAVNCLDPQEGSPCGKCQICKGVDDGSLLDVVEIDAASNNGVDDIRELREEAFFTPAVAKYRVYIIDEVHMLSPSAFNALLKILEEPPAHVIFILATTEVHKVLPTIISRCQRFDFHRIENEIIAGRLLSVAKSEDISLSPDAAELIARLSDGGMRDALSLLDVCAANSRDITAAVVANSAGLVGSEHLLEISGKILQGDTASVLRIIARLSQKSMDAQRLCEQLCGHYRNLMLVKTVAKPENLVSCLPSDIEMLREQANAMSLNDILHSMTVLQDACSRMSKSTAKRSELELALVTLCDNDAKTGYFALLSRIEKLENAMRKGAFAAAPATAVEADEPSKPVEQPKAEKKVQKEEEPYYNSGVLLIDLKRWRESQAEKRLLDFYGEKNGSLFACDQDTINGALKGEILPMTPRYNFFTNYRYFSYKNLVKHAAWYGAVDKEAFETAKAHPAIIHYMGDERPWIAGNLNHYRKAYDRYLAQTAWAGTPREKGKELYMLMYHVMDYVTAVCPEVRWMISRRLGMKAVDARKKK